MKQPFKLLAILITVSFAVVSCGGDKKKELIGKWEYQKAVSRVETSDKEVTYLIQRYMETSVSTGYSKYLEFTKKGAVLFDNRKDISYKVLGNKIITTYDSQRDTVRFSVNEDTLRLIYSAEYMKDIVRNDIQISEDVKIDEFNIYVYYIRKK